MNTTLAVCIPTFNRAHILDASLGRLVPLLRPHGIPICISDNASTDTTRHVVDRHRQEYPYIRYASNETNLGMDANFARALALSDCDYSWLLGDDDSIHVDCIARVLELLESRRPDALVVNGGSQNGRVKEALKTEYIRPGEVLTSIGWHMTWISSLILSRGLIREMPFEKYRGTYFSHFGSVFEALGERATIRVAWVGTACFSPSSSATFSWLPRILEIFSEKWTRVVLSLPGPYTLRERHACIRAHSAHTGLFSVMGFLNLRSQGAISYRLVDKHRETLKLSSQVNFQLIRLISAVPILPLRVARRTILMMRRFMGRSKTRRIA